MDIQLVLAAVAALQTAGMDDFKLVLAVVAAGLTSFGGSRIAVAVILTRLNTMDAQRKEDREALAKQRAEDLAATDRRLSGMERQINDLDDDIRERKQRRS